MQAELKTKSVWAVSGMAGRCNQYWHARTDGDESGDKR